MQLEGCTHPDTGSRSEALVRRRMRTTDLCRQFCFSCVFLRLSRVGEVRDRRAERAPEVRGQRVDGPPVREPAGARNAECFRGTPPGEGDEP